MVALGDSEGFADFLRDSRSCCGGKGENTRDTEFFRQSGQTQILGTEIVPPFRNAVGLVDRQHADLRPLDFRDKSLADKTLGCDIEKLEFSRCESFVD